MLARLGDPVLAGLLAVVLAVLLIFDRLDFYRLDRQVRETREETRAAREETRAAREETLAAREETRAALFSLTEELRHEIPPAQRARIEGSILAVVRGKVEAGVAFFVSPTTALTAAHNLVVGGSTTRHVKTVTCVRAEDRAQFLFAVAALDAELDVAVLRLRAGERPSAHFLTVPRSIGVAPGDKGMFLVTCNIRMAAEVPDIASVGIAWHQARIVSLHPNNFVYDSSAFDGDSGGAIVVARTGAVIGLHCELVNAARELIAHKEDVGERLNSIEESVKSLIHGTSSGCVGVRLDSAIVRSLLGHVE